MHILSYGVWSDEVEAICRGCAAIVSAINKKPCKWEFLLPSKFVESATLPDDLSPSESRLLTRQLSMQLDMFAKTLNNGNKP